MKDIYIGNIVDITDEECEFIREFNKEIYKYGAIAYNYESNSYQFIRHFSDIDCKKELLPDFIKVENTNELLNGLQLTIHYEFNPDEEDDEENLDIWNNEISQIELPVYSYDEDGEIFDNKWEKITTKPSKHVIWFLKKESFDYILDIDMLLLTPVIKNMNIAREIIQKFAIHPCKFVFDKKDADYVIPALYGVYEEEVEKEMFLAEHQYKHHHHCDCQDENHDCECDDCDHNNCDCQHNHDECEKNHH